MVGGVVGRGAGGGVLLAGRRRALWVLCLGVSVTFLLRYGYTRGSQLHHHWWGPAEWLGGGGALPN